VKWGGVAAGSERERRRSKAGWILVSFQESQVQVRLRHWNSRAVTTRRDAGTLHYAQSGNHRHTGRPRSQLPAPELTLLCSTCDPDYCFPPFKVTPCPYHSWLVDVTDDHTTAEVTQAVRFGTSCGRPRFDKVQPWTVIGEQYLQLRVNLQSMRQVDAWHPAGRAHCWRQHKNPTFAGRRQQYNTCKPRA
jgi:hypothetical protein